MTHPTNTDLADALRQIANTLPLGSALVVRLAADRLGEPVVDRDGWIEWDGSLYPQGDEDWWAPVAVGTMVDVKFRDGELLENVPAGKFVEGPREASGCFWQNEAGGNDIVAYRIVK